MDRGEATPSGIQFGPSASGKMYCSLYTHRGTRPQKSMWSPLVSPEIEYGIFCTADVNDWRCHRDHYWGLLNGGNEKLGLYGEKISKFPRNSNPNTPWHGYPVSPKDGGDKDAPSDVLIENWIANGIVSRSFGRRIQRRQI